jgi:DNA methylase
MARGFARCFGQDLMRGEHIVGGGKVSKRGVPGDRPVSELDPTSRKNVAAGRRKADAIPGGGGGPSEAHRLFSEKMAAKHRATGRAIATREWVKEKIDAGDIDGGMASGQSGTSIFDPVICEIAYRWFCPPGGLVLDPFAGGSVRGIVASRLGRKYIGVDLRPEQVEANKGQLKIAGKPKPEWHVGDSRELGKLVKCEADLVFSCPPYWNLEVYSEDEADLSTFNKEDFFAAQAQVIKAAVAMLKPDRFAVWVVGDVRDKEGFYANLPGRTVQAFEAAGARLYNDAILVTAAGSLPVRVRKQFTSGRKLGRTHQVIQVYCKGDWRKATQACGEVEFGDIEAALGLSEPNTQVDPTIHRVAAQVVDSAARGNGRVSPKAPAGSSNPADYGDVL